MKRVIAAFLAGHESFAAAEGAIKIALNVNKSRKKSIKSYLNGLGKDAAYLISRINGFTYDAHSIRTTNRWTRWNRTSPFLKWPSRRSCVTGADDARGNCQQYCTEKRWMWALRVIPTNPTRFQHPVAGIYKAERTRQGLPYFSVASGGGTGRTLRRQRSGRPCVLRHDRYHGQNAQTLSLQVALQFLLTLLWWVSLWVTTQWSGATVALAVAVSESQNA